MSRATRAASALRVTSPTVGFSCATAIERATSGSYRGTSGTRGRASDAGPVRGAAVMMAKSWPSALCRPSGASPPLLSRCSFSPRLAAAFQRSRRVVRRPDRRPLLLSGPRLADSLRRSARARLRGSRCAALLLRRRRRADGVGRGTVSEVVFSSAMLALGAALVFWLAARASGSIGLGFVAPLPSCCWPALLQLSEVPRLRGGHSAAVAFADAPGDAAAALAGRRHGGRPSCSGTTTGSSSALDGWS